MEYKAGDIIFLSRRKNKRNIIRWAISNSIALFTRKINENIDDVKVHMAIIYSDKKELIVRELDRDGIIPIPLNEYINKFKDRIEIVKMPAIQSVMSINAFNFSCKHSQVEYELINLFVWQSFRAIFHRWIGTDTPYKRICSEDVARQYNKLDYVFLTPEKTNPNDCYIFVKECILKGTINN